MRESFLLASDTFPELQLRSIDASDGERLREWKNAHRDAFFFQGMIDAAAQRKWYEGYLERPHDFMFVVEVSGTPAGCLGFRILDGEADIYNVIRADGSRGGRGQFGDALRLLCSYAQATFGCRIGAKVLKTNPALRWYERNGFAIGPDRGTHHVVTLDEKRFRPVPVRRRDRAAGAPATPTDSDEPMISVFGSKVGAEELEEVRSSLEAQWMGIGPKTKAFESAFAERLGLADFAFLDSASNSLHVAVKLLRLPAGSEVIVPSLTWIACAHAVVLAGHRPVFCDVELDTQNVSRRTIEPCLSPRTGAVMVVHYAGKPVEMGPIIELGKPVIEDAAHAVDSRLDGRACGALGDLGVYSFDAVKNLATPEGGGLTARDPDRVAEARLLRYCGIGKSGFQASVDKDRWWEYHIVDFMPKFLPNDVSAGIGLAQLRKLDRLQARRRELWAAYQRELAGLEWISRPVEPAANERHSYFTYLVRVAGGRRDRLAKHLYANNIYTTFRYHPLHLNPVYGSTARLPACERLNEEGLNLPLHPSLSDSDLDRVVSAIRAFRA